MVRRSFLIALFVVTTFAATATGTLAQSATVDPLDDAPELTATHPAGYYLWRGDHQLHLRTHGPGDAHHFVAYLRTDGVFRDVETVRAESHDRAAILHGGHLLAVDLHTYTWTDGVNFRVAGGHYLRLELYLDGQLIDTDQIFLGTADRHPRHNPFTIWV